jgi:hypothetical protein
MLSLKRLKRGTTYTQHTYTHTVLTVQNKGMPARYCVALYRKLANRDSTVPAGLQLPKESKAETATYKSCLWPNHSDDTQKV